MDHNAYIEHMLGRIEGLLERIPAGSLSDELSTLQATLLMLQAMLKTPMDILVIAQEAHCQAMCCDAITRAESLIVMEEEDAVAHLRFNCEPANVINCLMYYLMRWCDGFDAEAREFLEGFGASA